MNVITPYPGVRKTELLNANGAEASALVGDGAAAESEALRRDFATSTVAGTQRNRLINAACKPSSSNAVSAQTETSLHPINSFTQLIAIQIRFMISCSNIFMMAQWPG